MSDFAWKLKEFCDRNKGPLDLLVISGDLVHKGQWGEKSEALNDTIERLCKASGVPRKRVFMVPGNHDLDQRVLDQQSLLGFFVPALKGKPDGLFDLPEDGLNQLRPGFKKFCDFAADFELNAQNPHRVPGFYRADTEIGGVPVRLCGVNSALLCGEQDYAPGAPPDDRIVGLRILAEMLPTEEDPILTIVVSHFPPDLICRQERKEFLARLSQVGVLLITGHTHDAKTALIGSSGPDLLHFSSGATCGQFWGGQNHCRIIEFDPGNDDPAVHDLVWSTEYAWRAFEPMAVKWTPWSKLRSQALPRPPLSSPPPAPPLPPGDDGLLANCFSVGLVDIRRNRAEADRIADFWRTIERVANGSELIIVGRSLIDWASCHKGFAQLINDKGVHVKLGLLDPYTIQEDMGSEGDGSLASWIEMPIEGDWAIREVKRSFDLLSHTTVNQDAKGSLQIYGLPFYVSHSFIAFWDKNDESLHCIEEMGMAQLKDGRPMLEVSGARDDRETDRMSTSYAESLKSMYKNMLRDDRLILRKDATGTVNSDTTRPLRTKPEKFDRLGLHDIDLTYRGLNTPIPWLGKLLAEKRRGVKVLMVGRSLVVLTQELRYLELSEAILDRGWQCSFIIADPTRPDLESLVEDYATIELIGQTWPRLHETFSHEDFSRVNDSGGFIEVYGVFAYLPVTYASYSLDGKEHCVIEPGIGVTPENRPKLCFRNVTKDGNDVYTKSEKIYRDILNHCRCRKQPLLGTQIPADEEYVGRLNRSLARWKLTLAKNRKLGIVAGNAGDDGFASGGRGWFVGHFMDTMWSLRRRDDMEVKWGVHQAGEERSEPGVSDVATTMTLLVSGKFRMEFPNEGRVHELQASGDYVLYTPGTPHTWRVEEDAVVVTLRWPSVPE